MNAGQLRIGPVRFDVHTDPAFTVSYRDKAYAGFWEERGAERQNKSRARMDVHVSQGACELPDSEPIYRGGKNWAMWRDNGSLIVCSGFHGQANPRFYARVKNDLSSATLLLDPSREGENALFDAPFRYPLDQILTWGLLSQIGGVIMHAAVAVKDGVGCVFTGRSGAGKSTISSFCSEAGWKILNDDRVIVYPGSEGLMVSGTPWHGSGRYAEAAEVKLGAIFFIHKSANDWSESISSDESRLALLDVAAVPWFHDEWSAGALSAVEHISKNADFYRLHFTKSLLAVNQVEWVLNHKHGVVS